LELLRELTGGRRLPPPDRATTAIRRRMQWTIAHELPGRRPRGSDAGDLDALAAAIRHCDLVTCDAFMADVLARAHLDRRCELFSGRRRDVLRLRDRLSEAAA
jgi:hypothetical protein